MDLLSYLSVHGNQTKLAKETGVSRQIINKYSKGEGLPSLETAWKIEQATQGEVTMQEMVPAKVQEVEADSLI